MSSYGPYTGNTYGGSPDELHDMEAEAAASYAAAMEAENVNAMAESDERAIYEWARPQYKVRTSKTESGNRASYYDDVGFFGWCPPLDMNFAFDVCIPKLRAEGITAWFDNRDWYLDEVATENVSVDADFYSALLAYIKGVK